MLETIFPSDDLAFLTAQNERFPYLSPAFESMAAVRPESRYDTAKQLLKVTLRRGHVARQIPTEQIETVAEHIKDMVRLARSFNTASVPSGYFQHAIRMIRVHDLPEAVTGDFIPRDGLLKVDKARLEDMAARLIFETDRKRLSLFREYEANETPIARWVHDIDKLQMMEWVLQHETRFPDSRDKLADFWVAPLDIVKTELAKAEMTRLVTSRRALAPT